MRIAIIGSGISGLTAAYGLHRNHHVTLFEANDYLGGHTHTVDVEVAGEYHAIDTGFIVFNRRTYPRFNALLTELGLASQPTAMIFSVRCDCTGLEYNGSSLDGLFSQRGNLFRPRFYRMLRDIIRFNREAPRDFQPADDTQPPDGITVREFLARGHYSHEFAAHYLLPMLRWSCPGTVLDFPMRFVVSLPEPWIAQFGRIVNLAVVEVVPYLCTPC
jgi:predicted NAD/FAD-binding protein